jgi:hypothetical protein
VSKCIKYKAELVQEKDGSFNVVHIVITEQTYMGGAFGKQKSHYYAADGFMLVSDCCPEYRKPLGVSTCFLRGREKHKDMEVIVMPIDIYPKFKEAVLSYNTYFKEKD